MVTLARHKRHYFTRCLFLAILLFVTWAGWVQIASQRTYGSFSDLAYLGHSLFTGFSVVQFLAVALLVPALTAPVIAAEKDRNTLNLLLMTNLRHSNILLDKLLSRLVMLGLLLLSTLPLFLALLTLGGITRIQIWLLYENLAAVILFCSGVGLLVSTFTRKLHTSLIATYGLLAGYLAGLFALAAADIASEEFCGVLLPLSVPGWSTEYSFDVGLVTKFPIPHFLVYSLAVFLVCFFLSIRLLPRLARQEKRPAIKRVLAWLDAFYRRINFTGVVLSDPAHATHRGSVVAQESAKSVFARDISLFRGFYLLFIPSLLVMLVMLASIRQMDDVLGIIVFGSLILCALLATVMGAVAFAGEREKHSFEILLSTPITARDLVMGKFYHVLRMMIPILANALIWWAASWLVVYDLKGGLPQTFGLILAAAAQIPLLVVVGLWASATRRRNSTALLQAFLLTAGTTLTSLFVWFLFDEMFHLSRDTECVIQMAICGTVAVLAMIRGGVWLLRASREHVRFLAVLWRLVLFVVSVGVWCILMFWGVGKWDVEHTCQFICQNLTPISLGTAMFDYRRFSWVASALTVGAWIWLLRILIRRFDRMVGRQ
jgi:ABC-type transport system involved in multi-copper enzyme maturation permease subunit